MTKQEALFYLKGQLNVARKVECIICIISEKEMRLHKEYIEALELAIDSLESNVKDFNEPEIDELYKELNEFTGVENSPEKVFIFDVILCDNNVDKDGDVFSDTAIYELKDKFLGKTNIFDSNIPLTLSRIFKTEVIVDESKKNEFGNTVKQLKAWAYIIRSEQNKDFISFIESGILKETSISCCAMKRVCSICGKDMQRDRCVHLKNECYEGEFCRGILEDITDAYEWSFVTPPTLSNTIKY